MIKLHEYTDQTEMHFVASHISMVSQPVSPDGELFATRVFIIGGQSFLVAEPVQVVLEVRRRGLEEEKKWLSAK